MAIIGIGAELKGDDAVGVLAARRLKNNLTSADNFLVLEGGTLPENITSPLRRFAPELLILIDAADFGGVPGEIKWIDARQIGGASFSTHSMPLSLLADYLTNEIGCAVMILGIQPKSLEFDVPLSSECERAANEIAEHFWQIINH